MPVPCMHRLKKENDICTEPRARWPTARRSRHYPLIHHFGPMHPTTTRNEFLRLRVQGLSFARIARQLGVSKPTLIEWSRQCRLEIDARALEDQHRVRQEITTSAHQQIADLH